MNTLEEFFGCVPEAAVAFSGGVDSAYLLYAAVKWAKRVRAYYVKTPFQPAFELRDAERIASELSAPMTVLRDDPLSDANIASNPENRCYFCKKRIFGAIQAAMKADGFSVLLDGTNASDSALDRPGMRAIEELSVRSPLRECGLTKPEIRRLSKEAGLFTWEKPAYACLATRMESGVPITRERLAAAERAENALSSLGFRDFRVRQRGTAAQLELREEQLPLLLQTREEILSLLSPDYSGVTLNLEVRK